MPGDTSLLDPYDELVTVTIEGRRLDLPGNNNLLRLLQYLGVDLDPCRLCWNGDCDNCRFVFVDPTSGDETTAKGCEAQVVDGMCVVRIPTYAVWPPELES